MTEHTGFYLFPFLVRVLIFLPECLESLGLIHLENVNLDQTVFEYKNRFMI